MYWEDLDKDFYFSSHYSNPVYTWYCSLLVMWFLYLIDINPRSINGEVKLLVFCVAPVVKGLAENSALYYSIVSNVVQNN